MGIAAIQIRPMLVTIGSDIAQVESITCVPDVSNSLNNKYFLFMDAAGAKHYAWFNVSTLGTDPAPAGGWTGHAVAISANDTASAVASALAAVLTAVTGFDAASSGYVVTLTHTATGYAQPAYDNNSGFGFKVLTLGQSDVSAGCISGDIEVGGFEQDKVEIKCHDTGTTVRNELISGYQKPTLSFTLQESDKAAIKRIMIMAGMASFTPVGSDKEEVFGYGPYRVGGQNPKVKISLHPASLDASDKSEDWTFWSAEIGLDTFTFSGENVSTVPATFNIYPDEAKPKAIQFFMIGDAAKAGY